MTSTSGYTGSAGSANASNAYNTQDQVVAYDNIPIRRSVRPFISLLDAKRTILGITPEIFACPEGYITSIVNRFILSGNGNKFCTIAQVRLQALCIIGNLDALKKFIQEFSTNYGVVATELLLNGHIRSGNGIPHCYNFYMTPIFAALLWNDNIEIIRLLYSYGASICVGLDNVFPEEKLHTIPYFNHLSSTWGAEIYPQPMWRLISEFTPVISEIRVLSGELPYSTN